MIVKINYEAGYALVQGAVSENTGKEYSVEAARDNVRRRIAEDGHNTFGKESLIVLNETPHLISWIERATKKPFRRPFGEFVFRIVGEGFGKEPLNEWPK